MADLAELMRQFASDRGLSLPSPEQAREILARPVAVASEPNTGPSPEKLGIPERYADAWVETWAAETEAQIRVRSRLAELAKRFGDARRRGVNVTIRGTPGTGKTTLTCGVVRAVAASGYSALYVPRVAMFFRAMRESFGEQGPAASRVQSRYTSPDLLAVDEVGMQYRTQAELQMLGELLDERYAHRRPTILVTNLESASLAELVGERAADRLAECGMEVVCDWPSFRRRRAAGVTP